MKEEAAVRIEKIRDSMSHLLFSDSKEAMNLAIQALRSDECEKCVDYRGQNFELHRQIAEYRRKISFVKDQCARLSEGNFPEQRPAYKNVLRWLDEAPPAPCERYADLLDYRQKCAEWEIAWDHIMLGIRLSNIPGRGYMVRSLELREHLKALDPRRKPEPKPNWFVAEDFEGESHETA